MFCILNRNPEKDPKSLGFEWKSVEKSEEENFSILNLDQNGFSELSGQELEYFQVKSDHNFCDQIW